MTSENAGTKPEATASEDIEALLESIQQIIGESGYRIRASTLGEGPAWCFLDETRERLRALLTRAPRAESDIDWERKAKIYNTTCEAQKVRILELVARADAAEAERDDWKRKAESEYDNVAVISKHWRETMAERDRLKAIAEVSDAGYRKLMEDACILREKNEALREGISYAIERLERLKVQPTLAGHLSCLLAAKG